MPKLASLALPFCILLVACGAPPADDVPEAEAPEAPAADTAAVRAEIEAANAEHVALLNEGDVEGFAAVYTEDARILPPGEHPIDGRSGIIGYWQAGYDQMGLGDVELTTEEVGVFDDVAWEEGRFAFNTNDGPAAGKYIVIWQRGEDGRWRWHRDIWNFDPPAEGTAG